MSIILSTKNAVVLDHAEWIKNTYNNYITAKFNHCSEADVGVRNFQHLFSLWTPFLMDAQAGKIAKQMDNGLETDSPPRKKKRKGVDDGTQMISCPEALHITEVFTALRETPEFKKQFKFVPSSDNYRNNNRTIRDIRKCFTDIASVSVPIPTKGSCTEGYKSVTMNANEYIIPPNVEYICDDVSNILTHTSGTKYDLVVMDPPWENKYVRRRNTAHGKQHGYDMMNVRDILKLPVHKLMNDEGLLVVWCTNNENQIRELTEGLDKWNVKLIATWYWLKVTQAGVPVTPLHNAASGKRSYERILLGRKGKQEQYTVIPDGLVLCSIPSGIHSHKPPLAEVLTSYIPPNSRCIEIFARSLIPDWASYGLEVLKLQHSFLFSGSAIMNTYLEAA